MANLVCILFEKQHFYRRQIQSFCVKRIQDVNERIRTQIIKQVCTASIQSSSNEPNNVMSNTLFTLLLERTLDKKQNVRFVAIEYCAKLFAAHLRPFWRNNQQLPDQMRSLLPIPKKMVSI